MDYGYESPYFVVSYFYDPEMNWFLSEDGERIYDVNKYVSSSEIFVFKKEKKNRYVNSHVHPQIVYELIYPCDD